MYDLLLPVHILAATIWTGGHLVLALTILPRALKEKSATDLMRFESAFERVGIPALLVQVATGLWLAHRMVSDPALWFDPGNPSGRLIGAKLLLLAVTVAFAVDARLRVVPKVADDTIGSLAWHIIPVTVLAVLFVVIGASFQTGWLY